MEYIQAHKDIVSEGCVFCAVLAGEASEEERILHRGEHAFVTPAKYPYNPGHLLVLPELALKAGHAERSLHRGHLSAHPAHRHA